MTEAIVRLISAALIAFLVVTLLALVMAYPTTWLWNYLMPALFGLTKIHVGQALCINILSGIILKGTSITFNKR